MKNKLLLYFLVYFICIACAPSKAKILQSRNSIVERKQDSLSFELCQIYGLDQGIRKSEGFPNKMLLIQSIDTFNFKKIVAFVKAHGFPNQKLLGERNFKHECVEGAFGVILLHNPHRIVNEREYFNLFLNEVKKGNLTSDYLATVLDKYYWTKSKNKITRRVFYGSQFGKPCIQTKDATNFARIEIGLKPLENSGFVDCGDEVLDMPKERK